MDKDPLVYGYPQVFLNKLPNSDVHIISFGSDGGHFDPKYRDVFGDDLWEEAQRWLAVMHKTGYCYLGYSTAYANPYDLFYAAKEANQIKDIINNDENFLFLIKECNFKLKILESIDSIEQQKFIRDKMFPLD